MSSSSAETSSRVSSSFIVSHHTSGSSNSAAEVRNSVMQQSPHLALIEPVRAGEVRGGASAIERLFDQLLRGWWTSNHLTYGCRGGTVLLRQGAVPDRPQQPGLGRPELRVVCPELRERLLQRPSRRTAVARDPQRHREKARSVAVVKVGEVHSLKDSR